MDTDPVEAVEKILNYSFVDKSLLKEAITQTSAGCIKSSPLLDRLKFLGDSVLEVAFTNYIHLTYPNLKANELRKLRSANVSNEKLARVAVKSNLYHFLILEDPALLLDRQIKEFSEAVSKEDEPVPYSGLVQAPKILADLVESIAGAVYIDVNLDIQRLWEIFRNVLEPIYTPDDLKLQLRRPILKLLGLANKHGKRFDFRYSKDDTGRSIAEVYLDHQFFSSGCAHHKYSAKLLAAKEAVQKLSKSLAMEDVKQKLFEICSTVKLQLQTVPSSLPTASENPLNYEITPTEIAIDEDSPDVETEVVKGKLFEICSTVKRQLQSGSSSLPTASENPSTYEMTQEQMLTGPHLEPADVKGKLIEICSTRKPQIKNGLSSLPMASEMTQEQMVIDENCPHLEPKDVKGKLIEICSTRKPQIQNGLSSFPIASEMAQEQRVIDENRPQLEPKDVKGKLIGICSTRELQIQNGLSSSPTVSANPLTTYEMTIKQMVVDENSLEAGPDNAKSKLIIICAKNKWPTPIFSVEEEKEPGNEQKFVCSVKIEIPSVEGAFHMKGDAKSSKEQAEYSSAYHMIKALKSSIVSLVLSNLQVQESFDEDKNLHTKKKRRR